jgi:protein gp37
MGRESKIEWCDSTVNPIMGCNGCELHVAGAKESHCYAAGQVQRYAGLVGWPGSFDKPAYFPGRIEEACRWRDLTGKERPDKPWLNGMPRVIFLNDLSDSFTQGIDPETWLTPALPAIASSPHIWLLLSKRARAMRQYFTLHPIPKNLWPGVSVTGPATLKRIDDLLHVPNATVRFLSLEPLLRSTDVYQFLGGLCNPIGPAYGGRGLDWVILGFESGQNGRPGHPDWARLVRDQCLVAGVAFMMKQWGEYQPVGCADEDSEDAIPDAVEMANIERTILVYPDGSIEDGSRTPRKRGGWFMEPVGKGNSGRLLDGREWMQMPEVCSAQL